MTSPMTSGRQPGGADSKLIDDELSQLGNIKVAFSDAGLSKKHTLESSCEVNLPCKAKDDGIVRSRAKPSLPCFVLAAIAETVLKG